MDDRETLEDLALAAVKDAMSKANDLTQEKMSGITNGVKIPGMPF
jgi:DNA-binding protein YbaB